MSLISQHTILPDDVALQQNLSKVQLFFQMTMFFSLFCFCGSALCLPLSAHTQIKKELLCFHLGPLIFVSLPYVV